MLNKQYFMPEAAPINIGVQEFDCCPQTVAMPCCMAIDELKTELQQSVEDANNGLGITIKQARKRHPIL